MQKAELQLRKFDARMEQPGAFQCTILRSQGLPKAYRDVFLLRELQGRTLAEIAAILSISIETALRRLKRAKGAVDHPEQSASAVWPR